MDEVMWEEGSRLIEEEEVEEVFESLRGLVDIVWCVDEGVLFWGLSMWCRGEKVRRVER